MTTPSVFATGQIEQTPVWGNFIDIKDLEPFLQFGSVPEAERDARVQLIVDFACQWVQRYLGKAVTPTTFARRFSGWTGYNGSYISLPYYPVLEVKKVVEFRGISGPFELTEQTPENQGTGPEVYAVDPLKGLVIRVFQGLIQRPWFPGTKNIEIEWVAGYNPIPADIKLAAIELAAHWWRNTQQASRSAGPSVQEYDPLTGPGMWQGVPHRVTALLSPYTQIGLG